MRRFLVISVAGPLFVATDALGQTAPAMGGASTYTLSSGSVAPEPYGGVRYLNWSDLPFTISANQSFGYNDNVLGLGRGQLSPVGTPSRGDLFSTTVFGASTKAYYGSQQFFADGTYGFTRYRTDSSDDTDQYSLDGGVNWSITSHCSGRLVGAANEYQTPVEELIAPGINTVRALSFNETAKCLVTGYTSAIVDSGWSSTQNSNADYAIDDYRSEYVRGGIEYALSELDTFRALTTYTRRDFTDRGALSGLYLIGLANTEDQIDYQLQYHRLLTPKLTFDGMAGVSQIETNSSSPVAATSRSAPVYSASLAWQATPKLSFGAASARSIGAPTSVQANAQTSDTQSASITYQASPKISVQTGIGRSTYIGGVGGNSTGIVTGSGSALTGFCRAYYIFTPFLTATASYQYSDRTNLGLEAKDNTFMLGLAYKPK